MKFKFLVTLMLGLSIFAISSIPVLAHDSSAHWLKTIGVKGGHFIPEDCTDSKPGTKCDLNDALQTVINFTQIIFGLTGSIAILMFVYGGTMMIIGGARGGDDITKGKEAIKAAVVGLIIILGAWLAINFTILALTKGEVGGTATIFNNQPFNEPQATSGAGPSSDTCSGKIIKRWECPAECSISQVGGGAIAQDVCCVCP